jgi:hypothetical protein
VNACLRHLSGTLHSAPWYLLLPGLAEKFCYEYSCSLCFLRALAYALYSRLLLPVVPHIQARHESVGGAVEAQENLTGGADHLIAWGRKHLDAGIQAVDRRHCWGWCLRQDSENKVYSPNKNTMCEGRPILNKWSMWSLYNIEMENCIQLGCQRSGRQQSRL